MKGDEPLHKQFERLFSLTKCSCLKCGNQMELRLFLDKRHCTRCAHLSLIVGESKDYRKGLLPRKGTKKLSHKNNSR